MKKTLLVALVVVLALASSIWIAGSLVDREHIASSRTRYAQPPEAIWAAITDFPGMVAWWSEAESCERGDDLDGQEVWVMQTGFGPLPMAVVEREEGTRQLTRIADDSMPFGGTWTWKVEAVEGGATLTITERGVIRSPIFRFLSRFVMGYHGAMDGLMRDLGAKFGEDATPEHTDDHA